MSYIRYTRIDRGFYIAEPRWSGSQRSFVRRMDDGRWHTAPYRRHATSIDFSPVGYPSRQQAVMAHDYHARYPLAPNNASGETRTPRLRRESAPSSPARWNL
jgi:hypothetical protein